ncbi:MAG: 2OG-Fe(II) oxygenase [Bdellovibrionales bacterium]|nr:2OG-Fe(II) oxygenase [Bdellovibrionales bacterium]
MKESYEIEAKDELRPAAIGKGLIKQRNTDIRTDKVHWLETFETKPQRLVYDIFEGLRQLARTELYLPLKRFECHFSKYEAGGFYKRHSDRHANLPSRVLSCVIYLSDLMTVDGGELVLYLQDEPPVIIQPTPGKIIVFDSSIEHEVKPCSTVRRSLTGWLRTDLHPNINL